MVTALATTSTWQIEGLLGGTEESTYPTMYDRVVNQLSSTASGQSRFLGLLGHDGGEKRQAAGRLVRPF